MVWSQTLHVAESVFELLTPGALPAKCWNYRSITTCPAYTVLGSKLKPSCMLDKHLPTEQHPQPPEVKTLKILYFVFLNP